jgi:hypothetical protein
MERQCVIDVQLAPVADRGSVRMRSNFGSLLSGHSLDNDKATYGPRLVAFYKSTVDACRRAALCTFWCFRRRLGKDIATIISKMVYASLDVPEDWTETGDRLDGTGS